MSPRPNHGGYLQVLVQLDGKRIYPHVAHLVLEAFIAPRPEGMQACHNDGNPQNNYLDNLRWDTPSNNNFDKVRHGTHQWGEKNNGARLTLTQVEEVRKIYSGIQPSGKGKHLARMGYPSYATIAQQYGVSPAAIGRIVRGTHW